MLDKGKGDGFYPSGWIILPRVAAELLQEDVVDVVLAVETRVWGPHTGKRLPDGPEGSFHCASPDRLTAGGKDSGAIAVGEDLESGDGVGVVVQGRWDVQGTTIVLPSKPVGVTGEGAGRYNAGADRLHCSAVIKAESIAGLRWEICQGCSCG